MIPNDRRDVCVTIAVFIICDFADGRYGVFFSTTTAIAAALATIKTRTKIRSDSNWI